jgi:hypothetical protein
MQPNATSYQIRLASAPDGELRRAPVLKELPQCCRDFQGHDVKHYRQKIIYADGRHRRLIYETNSVHGRCRYVFERDGQRTVFATLRMAVMCLAGCIDRNE